MSYPRVEIDLEKIKYNTVKMVDLCSRTGIKIVGVTKVFCGLPEIANCLIKGGVDILGDSRIENLKKLEDVNIEKMLLRIPMISQAGEVVTFADISLNSELNTIRKLSECALNKGRVHKVILMIDVGDLREGYFDEDELIAAAGEVLQLKGVKLIGLGTNVGCYCGVMPSSNNLSRLVEIKNKIDEKHEINLDVLSGGNSSSLSLIQKNAMPEGITQLRLGAALSLGIGLNDEKIDGLYYDAFKLKAEIVEVKEKPTVPVGGIGLDAFGQVPIFQDRGIRKKAICAVGKQDVDFNNIIPEDNNVMILGGSSDYLILDITDCDKNYYIGDIISFNLTYAGVMNTMTSEYVSKILI